MFCKCIGPYPRSECCRGSKYYHELLQVVEGFRIHAPIRTVIEKIKPNMNILQPVHCVQLFIKKITLEFLPPGLSSEHFSVTVSPS